MIVSEELLTMALNERGIKLKDLQDVKECPKKEKFESTDLMYNYKQI